MTSFAPGFGDDIGLDDQATSTQLTITDTQVELNGKLKFAGASSEQILSDGSLRIDIDNDNTQTDRIFVISKDNAATELFRIQENGNVGIGETVLTAKLHLKQTAASNALFIDQDGNSPAINIDSESTTSSVLQIIDSQITTGNVLRITGTDALTTGRCLFIDSNSADTSVRQVALIQNLNSAATGTTTLFLSQQAANQMMILDHNATAAGSSYIDFQGTTAANSVNPISTLTTSGTTTHHIQIEINGVKAWIAASTTNPS